MAEPSYSDDVPMADEITGYDREHLTLYLRLLDLDHEGTSVDDMARELFGIDAVRDPQRARIVVHAHLRRARWMTLEGYKLLLEPEVQRFFN
ncbi:MAG: DUF2285 domain-containing protein [Sphingomonadales bacterium]|nr:DUF2285 domain-containing protein [Sphingomonadales bacterium]